MKKIITIIAVIALASMSLCGCGKSNSHGLSKTEMKDRIIRKYSGIVAEENIRAALGEHSSGGNASIAIITLTKKGHADEFQADLEAYNAAK